MKKKIAMDLQLFSASVVEGRKLIYLFRRHADAATVNGACIAFVTENERSKSRDADATETKDGPVATPGALEHEITATALLSVGGDIAYEDLEDWLDNADLLDIWEANIADPATTTGKYKGRYMQGYLTELSASSPADDHAEVDVTFTINGKGVTGEVTVTPTQIDQASYVFTDTPKTGV